MKALYIIIPAYLILFLFYGRKNLKGFLLLTGLMTLPFRTTYSVVTVGDVIGWTDGIIVTLSDISFFLLFVYLLFRGKKKFTVSPSLAIPAFCFILACTYSLINTTWVRMTVFQIIFVAQLFFLYYFVLVNAIESEKELKTVVVVLIASLCFQAVFSVIQFTTESTLDLFSTGRGTQEFFTIADEAEAPRVYGTIGAPNSFGAYIVPLLLLTLAVKLGTKLHSRAIFLVAVLGGLALLFSFSRGAWLSFSVSFLLLLWVMRREHVIRFKTILGALFVFLVVVAVFLPEVETRLLGYDRNAAMSRIPLLKIAWNMIEAHPIFGVGTNTFASVTKAYTLTPDLKGIYLHEVHNQYLLVFAEAGLLGFVAFVWFMIAAVKKALFLRRSRNVLFRSIGLGIGFGLVASMIHMMVDMFNSHMLMGSLFVSAAIVTAAGDLEAESETAGEAVRTTQNPVRGYRPFWEAGRRIAAQ